MASRVFAAAFLLFFAFTSATEVAAVESTELDSMLNALRDRGYHRFSNAVATSDLVFEILGGKSFTVFAPTDSALFALDMSNTASDYTATLRCHIIPSRISIADIHNFPSEIYFPTLFKSHRATIRILRLPLMAASENFITVDRVGVTFPGIFYSLNIAVHGLGGIINCNSHQGSPWEWPPVPSNTSGQAESPSSENQSLPSGEIPKNGIESPEGEQFHFGSAPANSREPLLSRISPAWSEVQPPAVTFVPTTETPVAPEFSENDDRTSFPPSSMMMRLHNRDFVVNMGVGKTEHRDHPSVTSPEDQDGTMETVPEESQPPQEKLHDCTRTSTASMYCSSASNNFQYHFPPSY